MELALAGVKDGYSDSRVSIAERLSELRTIEHGWANLHFRRRYIVRLPKRTLWKLSGGILAHGIMTFMTRGLLFTELPSTVRESPEKTWEHGDSGVQIREFGMDPAQDLLILIEYPENAEQCVYCSL